VVGGGGSPAPTTRPDRKCLRPSDPRSIWKAPLPSLPMTPLEIKLIRTIGDRGPIRFRDFMEAALYDADHGYYNTTPPKIGTAGDYYTSSNVHSVFGSILAGCFLGLWGSISAESSHAEKSVEILELGAGTGQLAYDIIATLQTEYPKEYGSLKYQIAEISPRMQHLQREKLADFSSQVVWTSIPELGSDEFPGVIFSNELMDAMPAHVIRRCDKGLQELYVNALGPEAKITPGATSSFATRPLRENNAVRLGFEWRAISTPRILDYVNKFVPSLRDGQVIEVNLGAIDLLAAISRSLTRGFLVTIDYGDIAAHLYGSDRRSGTLRSFQKHAISPSVLDRVGQQDITASVNFSALIEYGREVGFETVSYERQSTFLIRNGLIERIAAAMSFGSGDASDLKDRLALKNLFLPGGVSDNFRVLIQRKL
jgi:SAM-dependent MidA family methyltransferase